MQLNTFNIVTKVLRTVNLLTHSLPKHLLSSVPLALIPFKQFHCLMGPNLFCLHFIALLSQPTIHLLKTKCRTTSLAFVSFSCPAFTIPRSQYTPSIVLSIISAVTQQDPFRGEYREEYWSSFPTSRKEANRLHGI